MHCPSFLGLIPSVNFHLVRNDTASAVAEHKCMVEEGRKSERKEGRQQMLRGIENNVRNTGGQNMDETGYIVEGKTWEVQGGKGE